VHRFYSPRRKVALNRTQGCSVFYWSNLNIKDMLARLAAQPRSRARPHLGNPAGLRGRLTSSKWRASAGRKKGGKWLWVQIGDRPNHYFDCEAMQVTGRGDAEAGGT